MSDPNDASLRRIPSQARSRERVERMLDAAAQIFGEVGYDAATTESIAARAETSIGSLYQFFPNKPALFTAVAFRHLERSREVFDGVMAAITADTPWETLLDRAVDVFAAFDRADPSFRAVWRNWHVAGEFLAAGEALTNEFARQVEGLLKRYAKKLAPAKRNTVALMVVQLMSAMLLLAARTESSAAAMIVGETKLLLLRYLSGYTDAPPPPAKRARSANTTRPRSVTRPRRRAKRG